MKIAILGAGAMGSVFGALLAQGPNDVTLIDVRREIVDAVNASGLSVRDKQEQTRTIPVRATGDPRSVGICDLVIVFVKCYHTEAAARDAAPLLGPETPVLSLQNGWGNGPRIATIVGAERVLLGVTYHSATVLGPGRIHHAGQGKTLMGELAPRDPDRVRRVADAFNAAGIETEAAADIRAAIWSKLCLNVCTLPTSALLGFKAGELAQHAGTLDLMQALLRETVDVAQAQGIALDYAERWAAICAIMERAAGAKASMLQDVEQRRQTEIDVINGAIVASGEQYGIPTPYNQAMVWLVRALQESFAG
jgi:2-dehydropantoate 2-reductase